MILSFFPPGHCIIFSFISCVDHITPVLKKLHWPAVRKRIEFKILLLAYKCLHGTATSYLRELLKEYVPPRTLRSTSKNLLCEPRTTMKTYGDRSFSACAQKLWNQLPDEIRAAGSVAIFKRQLKTHLFKDVYINELCGYQHLECNAPLSMFIWKGRNIK